MKNFHANKTQNMSGQHRESVKSAANPHSTRERARKRECEREREGQMMAIKSKHKAPTLTILRQKQAKLGGRENSNRSTQRGVLKRGLPRCGVGLPTCFVLYCSPHFCQQQTLQREQGRKEQNKMIQKFVLMPRTFYAFLYNFFSSFCSVCLCVCSSSLPHIVLHLCSDSSKNAVCLSPPLPWSEPQLVQHHKPICVFN